MRRGSLCAVGRAVEGEALGHTPSNSEGVDWTASATTIHNQIRGLRPWPHAFTFHAGKRLILLRSSIAERDFCAACGTPLSFRRIGGPKIEIMTGAFDRPDRVIPTLQFGTESRLGWVGTIVNLPSKTTLQNYGPEKLGEIVSHQHPDHD